MTLLSLKRYLSGPEEEAVFRRLASLLFRGIILHAVEGEKSEYQQFQRDLEHIQSEVMREEASGPEVLIAGGKAVQAMADHGHATTRFIRQHGALLQNMVAMLTQTMVAIGAGGERSAARLQDIQRQLTHAADIEDIQKLKLRLGDCLQNLREEVEQQRNEALQHASQIQAHVEMAQQHIRNFGQSDDGLDLATGLQTRSQAEAAFQQELHIPGRKYLVIAVVSTLPSVNKRFGYAVGDRVLKTFAETIRGKLSGVDRIFRWRGPAFVALLERDGTIEAVRAEISAFGNLPTEKMFDTGDHSVLLPLHASWLVLALTPPTSSLMKAIDSFVASHGGGE